MQASKINKYQSAVVGNKNSFTIEMKWLLLILVIVAFVILLLVKNAIHNGQKAGKKPIKNIAERSGCGGLQIFSAAADPD